MEYKASDLLIIVLLLAALMFFGTAVWMIVQHITSEKIRWILDILSALLFILIFFWLLILEDSIKGRE